MKIRSWTGDEVEARVGMIVSYRDYGKCVIAGIGDDFLHIDGIDNDWKHSYVSPSECTMLHCPFQVGDEVICWDLHYVVTDILGNLHKIVLDGIYRIRPDNPFLYHANPALRDSPEYKEESK